MFENIPVDPAAIFENPQFIDVNAFGNGFEVLQNFMLLNITVLKDKGILIQNNGDKDLFGHSIKGTPNIGIHEF